MKKGYRYMGMHNQDPIVYNKDLISVFIFIMKTLWKFHFQRDLYPSFVRTYMVGSICISSRLQIVYARESQRSVVVCVRQTMHSDKSNIFIIIYWIWRLRSLVMSPSPAEGFSAWLGSWPFYTQLETKNRPKTSRNFDFVILNNYFSKIGLKCLD